MLLNLYINLCLVQLKRVATVSLLCVALQTVATVFALSVSQAEHSSSSGSSKDNTTSSKSVAEQPLHGSSNSSSSVSSTSSSSSSSSSRGGSSKPPKKLPSKSGSSSRGRSRSGSPGGGKIARYSSFDSDLDSLLPIGYRYKYASDYDSYYSSSYSFIDLDTDIGLDSIDLHEPIWFPLHYDVDLDLDLDLDDIDLDLDLLKLKYGLYGLNHYSLHNPRFNDYRFRSRYRSHSRPYFRAQHRYLPQYWKHDLDFWGLDNYGLGFGYDKYLYLNSLSTPTSYSHISTF
ncbi:uncharacterized protein DDB_G0271670-like [Planococcus citri]|uniref:uncharacterized protein DDB_G0271670-like n=1 Tax=Planococcus citri TaxID=170843 RepID=UPI0031F98700